jgi:hypothetical protein
VLVVRGGAVVTGRLETVGVEAGGLEGTGVVFTEGAGEAVAGVGWVWLKVEGSCALADLACFCGGAGACAFDVLASGL